MISPPFPLCIGFSYHRDVIPRDVRDIRFRYIIIIIITIIIIVIKTVNHVRTDGTDIIM